MEEVSEATNSDFHNPYIARLPFVSCQVIRICVRYNQSLTERQKY